MATAATGISARQSQTTVESDTSIVGVDEGLIRALGVRAFAANIVNLIVGSGIFVLPAAVAGILGNQAILAYLLCAIGMGLVTLCFAELGSRVTRSGGTYAYIEAAFGPRVGFIAGFLIWFGGDVISGAAVGVLVVDSLMALLGIQASALLRGAVLIALFAALALANIRGVKTGAKLVEVLTAAKLIPLVLLIFAGFYHSDPQNFAWSGFPSIQDLGRSTLILVFVFSGTEGAINSNGEVKTPATTIPRAIMLAMLIVTSLYIGVQLSAQGILGPELAHEDRAPLAAAAGKAFGSGGRQFIATAVLISTLGFLTGSMLAIPRILFAFARDGSVPRVFASIHPRFRTPHIAIVTHAALGAALALTGTFSALAVLSVLPTLVVYFGCCVATLKLRRRDNAAHTPESFRIPGGATVPVAAILFVLWLFSTATLMELVVVLGIAALAYTLRTVTRWYEHGESIHAIR
ncbi:MAG TPA: APC family permease [Gemmatimonadaceae bacterium]